jgi:hypothetical protein
MAAPVLVVSSPPTAAEFIFTTNSIHVAEEPLAVPIAYCSVTYNMIRDPNLSVLTKCEVWLLNHQDMMQMLIVWSPRVHDGFISNEWSNEDNTSCCFLMLVHGRHALFLFLAFDSQGAFQGVRCGMISIIRCLRHDRYIDSPNYLGSNSLKVFHIPWDPGGSELFAASVTTAWGQAVFLLQNSVFVLQISGFSVCFEGIFTMTHNIPDVITHST